MPSSSRRPVGPVRATAQVVASVLLAVLALVPASAEARAAADYEPVRALGPAKSAGKGLKRVKLQDQSTVLTHGLDPEPSAHESGTLDFPGPEREPLCAEDHFQHVLYGYPLDAPNRLASVRGTIVAEIRRMNALLNEESLASGGRTADYKVKCDNAGEIQVEPFQGLEPNALTSFAGVVSAAKAAGFHAANADYTIFYDSSAPPACGTATFSPDERLSTDNANNSGGGYAVVYSNCWEDRTAMHENGHNQGAVQYSAPYSTGSGGHCYDGYDIMCYSDGGDRDVGFSVFCPDKMRFDCRHDTYFDAAPESGEYLASNWNLGSPLNRFIAFDQAGPAEAACSDGLDNDGDERRDFPGDPGCASGVDTDESGPAASSAGAPSQTADWAAVLSRLRAAPSALPTLTIARATRYARTRIKRRSRRAKRIRVRCARRSRTSATCRVSWRLARRGGYRGRMVVSYRYRGGEVALASRTRVRRIR